VVHDLRT